MGQILIRNVDDATIASYEERARARGHSLEKELRELLEANRPLAPSDRLAASRAVRAMQDTPLAPLTLDEIREGLE